MSDEKKAPEYAANEARLRAIYAEVDKLLAEAARHEKAVDAWTGEGVRAIRARLRGGR